METRKRIAIFGSDRQDNHLEEVSGFFAAVDDMDVEMCVESGFARYLESLGRMPGNVMTVDSLPDDVALVVSIGGDGTFLRASDWTGARETPVMGINTGHLGYLAGFSFEAPQEVFAAISGRYEISERMVLEVESEHLPKGFRSCALNEISVAKGDTTSMVSIRASVDGRYLADYLADGLIFATPTGSTAYSLSCGGPILQPTVHSIVLTPIAPHSLTFRPLVIDGASELRIEVSSRGEQCHVGVDGHTFVVPADGTELTIRRARHIVKVAQPTGSDFASVLRCKLGWGERK